MIMPLRRSNTCGAAWRSRSSRPLERGARRRRPIAPAVEHGLHVVQGEAFGQDQVGSGDGARGAIGMAHAIEPPGELAIAPQDAPHAIGYGAAIAAADEAAGAEEGVGDQIGRPLGPADDLVQKFYGGGKPRARCHVSILSGPAATMNMPAVQRFPN